MIAGSCHIVVADQRVSNSQKIHQNVAHMLEHDFKISHSTIQVEVEDCGGHEHKAHSEHHHTRTCPLSSKQANPNIANPYGDIMAWIITKYFVTAAIVVIVSEAAKRSDKLGGFIAALPLVTVLALIWLYVENQPQEKIANHAWYTFWYVVPTLPMFLAFPALLPRIGFWPTLLACIVITVVCFGLFALAVRRFGIELL